MSVQNFKIATNTYVDDAINNADVPHAMEISGSTISAVIGKLRGKPGCIDSCYLPADTTVSKIWYNFLWILHRIGHGADNANYGALLLYPMTSNSGTWYQVQYINGTIYTHSHS